jgi:hypothetical protein
MTRERLSCKNCSKPPAPGKVRCEECAELHNLTEAKRRAERRAAGLCVVCGAPAALDDDGEPQSLCPADRETYAYRREQRKQRAKRKRTRGKETRA